MTALIYVLAVLLGLSLIPVGLRASYDEDGAALQLLVGPFHIQLYPEKVKRTKKKTTRTKKSSTRSAGKTKKGGNISDFYPIVEIVLEFLNDFRRKLRVDRLTLKIVLAGEDPCDLSVNYGRAWAALGNLMPQLDRFLHIRKRDLDIACNYIAERTTVLFGADITITIGRLLLIAVRHGFRGLFEYFKLLKTKKGGAQL